jgi:hypothetical protein
MNKKMVILIEFIVCVMSIIIISIFGNMPEVWRDFEYCKTINFAEDNVELPNGTQEYQLIWFIGPQTATNKQVRFTASNDNVIISSDGLVTFSRQEGVTIMVKTTDGSNLKAYIDITFKAPGGGTIVLD